jgi:tetratricopeptide (TPR) repeat protein
LSRARTFANEARAHFEDRDDRWRLAFVIETQGQIALAAGAPNEAIELSTECLRMAEATDNKKAVLDASLLLARAQRARGDLGDAAATLEKATDLAAAHRRRGQLQAVLSEWSDVTAERGDLAAALALSRRAIDAGRH